MFPIEKVQGNSACQLQVRSLYQNQTLSQNIPKTSIPSDQFPEVAERTVLHIDAADSVLRVSPVIQIANHSLAFGFDHFHHYPGFSRLIFVLIVLIGMALFDLFNHHLLAQCLASLELTDVETSNQ